MSAHRSNRPSDPHERRRKMPGLGSWPVRVALLAAVLLAAAAVTVRLGTPHAHAVAPDTVTITAPADGSSVSGRVELVAQVTDRVDAVTWAVDGSSLGTVSAAPWSLTWDTTTVADGSHEITATADLHGEKTAAASPVTVTVRNAATTATPSAAPATSTPTTPAPAPASAATDTSAPCGRTTTPPARYDHVVWIVFENHSYADVIGNTSAPYLNALAARCGSATNMYAETHPSLPNYIAMTSGSTQGITDDAGPASHPLSSANIFSQAGDWRSLEESMPTPCAGSASGEYAPKHNPAAYYLDLAGSCPQRDVPLGSPPDISAAFTFVTPNLCNDMHDCSVATGDQWLSSFLPQILQSAEYAAGRTAVFITWDEDDSSSGNHIPTLVVAPSVPAGTHPGTAFTHYSMLRTTEELLGLNGLLGNAATAPSMRAAFGL